MKAHTVESEPERKKQYVLKTLGCKANLSDSQRIELELQKRGWIAAAEFGNPVDLCIVNSCTVTDEADRQSRKIASKMLRQNPMSTVVVTGCAAEIDPERLKKSLGIHYVIGNRDKQKLVDFVLDKVESAAIVTKFGSKHDEDKLWPDLGDEDWIHPGELEKERRGFSARTRSFLKIQEGCNSFCTFCIIPYGRGPSRSLSAGEVLRRIESLVNAGVKEIVLTGTNLGDFPDFDHLLLLIFEKTALERLRVRSLDPLEISDSILDLMDQESRFCPHFHVSLQSPNTRILKLMKRKYKFEDVEKCLQKIMRLSREKFAGGPFVGMDVITGFPGEAEEDFEWSLQALKHLPWSRLHVFPYSEREGTPALRIQGSVEKKIRRERAARLCQLSLDRIIHHYQKILVQNESAPLLPGVLLENSMNRTGKSWLEGHTSNYLRCRIPWRPGLKDNPLVSFRPKSLEVDNARGEVSFLGSVP